MPAYEAYKARAATVHDGHERVALFKRMVVARYPEVADDGVFPSSEDQAFVRYLNALASLDDAMHDVDVRLRSELPVFRAAFKRAIPEFSLSFPTYIVPSFTYNGATAELSDGTPVLMLGVPVLAGARGAVPDRVLFAHEYFHLYHQQVTPALFQGPRLLGHELWKEGLATYASEVISGDHDPADLFYDAVLAKRAPAIVAGVAEVIAARYSSPSAADRAAYFQTGRSPDPQIPARAGYAAGYVVARNLGARRTLSELAALRGDELDRLVRAELLSIAAAKPER